MNQPDETTIDLATQAFAALRAINRSGGRCTFPESHPDALRRLQQLGRVTLSETFDVCGAEFFVSFPTPILREAPF